MEGSTSRQRDRNKISVHHPRHGAHHTQKEADDKTQIAPPSFLKVIEEKHLTSFTSLSIPEEFMEEHGHRIEDVVRVSGPSGYEFHAFLGKDRVHTSFRAGFACFLRHHNVQAGETLLFSLVANSTFRITVYNENGGERKGFTRSPTRPRHHNKQQGVFKSSDLSFSKQKLRQEWDFFAVPHRQAQRRRKEISRPYPHNGAGRSDTRSKKRRKTELEEDQGWELDVEVDEDDDDDQAEADLAAGLADGLNEGLMEYPFFLETSWPEPGIGIVRQPGLESDGERSELETRRKPRQCSPKNSTALKEAGPSLLVRQNSCTSEKKVPNKENHETSLKIKAKRKKVQQLLTSEVEPRTTFPRDSKAPAPKEALVLQLAAVEACKTHLPTTRLHINKISATHSSAAVWRNEQRTFYIGSSRVKLILVCEEIFPTEFAEIWIPSDTEKVHLTTNARWWSVSWDPTHPQKPSLGSGWSRFAKENDLRDGDVCVLQLVQPLRVEFQVHLFRIADFIFKDLAPQVQFVEPPGNRVFPFNGIGVEKEGTSAPERRAGSRGRKSIAVDANIREAVNALQLKNPHIPIVMRVGHIIRQYNVYLPQRLPMPRESTYVNLLDTAGVKHPAIWLVTSGGRRLAGGWKEFALEKEIEVGDVCVFEVTDHTDLEIMVHILRKGTDHIIAKCPQVPAPKVQPQVQAEADVTLKQTSHAAICKPATRVSPLYRALRAAALSKNIKKMPSDNTKKNSTKGKSVANPAPKKTPAQESVVFSSTKKDAKLSSRFLNTVDMGNDAIVASWLPGPGHRLLVKLKPVSTRPTMKLQLVEVEDGDEDEGEP